MKKLPYIRQGQQLTIDILNGIIKAINSSILERKEYDSMMADITRMFNSYQSKVDNFILKYQDVVDNTPGLMDLLQSYSTLASMVNGTYVASIGSVNITSAGFNNIQGTMGRAQFEDVRNDERTYPQYSSLLITELGGATTLVYNVAPFEGPPRWIEIDAIAGPQGPPGPPGLPGPRGENGEDGEDGQVASIKGVASSLNECLGLNPAPRPNDAYVVEDGDDVNLYVYVGGDHTQSSSWIALNNIRGPVGPQGEMAEISIQYSNYADGSNPSDVYNNHSFMIISEDGGNTRHVIKLTPKLKFEIVRIQESNNITTPYAEHTDQFFEDSNETSVTTTITIPTLRTIESASLVDKHLHLQYRGTAGTTNVGRVVYDPAKIIFMNSLADFSISTVREGDVIINTADYSIYNVVAGTPRLQGSLQGPPGPAGPVGASFKLVGEWVTYGEVEASAENVGNAYFLSTDDGGHQLGLYVSSETSPGVYGWVFVGNSEGPQGATGATGPIGPRGTRITAGEDFYFDEEDSLQVPANTDNTYKQNDLYLNTTSWDLFEVTAIGSAPNYTISAVLIGNIKGLGVTNITVDEAAENLTITYSGGSTTVVPIHTIRVSPTEYTKRGLLVHCTDGTAKGEFSVLSLGVQSNENDPATYKLMEDNVANIKMSGIASVGTSNKLAHSDHVHPAQTTISGNAGSATRLGTSGTQANSSQLVLGNGRAPGTIGGLFQPIYLSSGVPTATTLGSASAKTAGSAVGNVPVVGTGLGTTQGCLVATNNLGELIPYTGTITNYDKVIRTQAEFEDMIADGLELNNTNIQNSTWRGAKSVALIGDQFVLDYTGNCGVKIPQNVKQIHGFNSAKITITNFVYIETTAKGGLWYGTAPTTNDYSIRDLEVSCTGTTNGCGFRNCNNLSNCTGTGTNGNGVGFSNCNNLSNCTGTGTGGTGNYNGFGFYFCNNLSNCTGKGTGTANGCGFYNINYAVNCKNGGYSTNMWGGTNNNINVETCRKTPEQAVNTTLNA